ENLSDRDRYGLLRRHLGEAHDQVSERGERRGGAAGEGAILEASNQTGPQRVRRDGWRQAGGEQRQRLVEAGRRADVLDRVHYALADAARRHVDHPAQADVVVRVDHQAHVGERVLDLLALVEPHAADHLVADALTHQRVFYRARLGVGAVENRDGRVHIVG